MPLRSPYWIVGSNRELFRRPGNWLLKFEIAVLLGARKVKFWLFASNAVALALELTRVFRALS